MNKKGFTLIELLIVIAIMGILSGALLLVINPKAMIQKGRDAKRMEQIESLAKAINLALAEDEITLIVTGECSECSSAVGDRELDGNGWVKYTVPEGKQGLSKYIPTLPIDPVNVSPTFFIFGSTLTDFELNAYFEHPDNLTRMSTDGGDNASMYEMGSNLTVLN